MLSNINDAIFDKNSQRRVVLNYFHKKRPSQIFEIILNTPLSYEDSICYYNTEDKRAHSRAKILGQLK